MAAVACSPSRADRSSTSTSAPAATHHAVALVAHTAAQASPEQRRAEFEQLLGMHALLAVRLMRGLVVAAPDFVPVASAALQDNTDALTQLITTAYGNTQADRFKQLWQRHLKDLLAYANGVAANNASAKQAARKALMADAEAYGSWLAGASNGRVRAGDAAAGVRMHVEELMTQADAYAAHDYDKAYLIERQAYEHMFTTGATLAKASVTPELAVGFDAPPEKLRAAFAMLLGEHMELIISAQRATFAGAPEFKAAATQVNANTIALTKGMDAIVGPKKAKEFQSAWADHVEGLLAYSTAVAGKDDAAKTTAMQNLDAFAARLALYFSDIVRNELPVEPLTDALTMHDKHLTNHVDAYAAKRYDEALQMEREGYEQMLGVAYTLVGAIQKTVKPKLPVGGSQTGLGGTAHRRR
jgi:hypothetical protein